MKKLKIFTKQNKLISILLVAVFGFCLCSCEDEDKKILNDILKTGGFVRFETPFPKVVDVSSLADLPNISIITTLETPDNNVASYSMEVSATISGVTIGPVPFGTEITSFPASIEITATQLASDLDIDISDLGFADSFTFKGTSINDQGTVFSSDRLSFDSSTQTAGGANSTNDLLDEDGYRNAFEFGFAIPCPPESGDIAGDWILDMIDLYGDGWDNAFVTVAIDGVATDYTVDAGSAQTHVVTVPAGTQNLVISYTTGSFEEEHVYSVEKPDGTVLGPFGPNPGACLF